MSHCKKKRVTITREIDRDRRKVREKKEQPNVKLYKVHFFFFFSFSPVLSMCYVNRVE